MYHHTVNFQLPIEDYEKLRNLAHESRNSLSEILREGAEMVIEKYKTIKDPKDADVT